MWGLKKNCRGFPVPPQIQRLEVALREDADGLARLATAEGMLLLRLAIASCQKENIFLLSF